MERSNEKQKETCRENRKHTIDDAREMRDAYVRSWPQPVSKEFTPNCLSAYCKATQLKIMPVCCVCSRQQFEVPMHEILLSAGANLPDYFSILTVTSPSLGDNEFWFTDSRLNGMMLDSNGIRTDAGSGDMELHVCHPGYTYLPRSSMPRFTLVNKLYRGHLPEEF